MSHNQQQQHPPSGGPPPQGQYHYPPQGYQQQWPPQQHQQQQQQSAYGQQPTYGYGAPPQAQYYPPGGQYPPQQQQQGAFHSQQHPGQYPPPQQGQYPHQQYGQYPPPQQGQFHQQVPSNAQYGQPPSGLSYQQQPQSGHYPMPPQGQPGYQQLPPMAAVPPTPPSLGYDQNQALPQIDVSKDVEGIRKAMKGMGCDEKKLVEVFTNAKFRNPLAMKQLQNDYNQRFMRDLVKDIESETRGDFEDALKALVRGPLVQDVKVLVKALDRAGTDEDAVMDVLLCRSNADLRIITAEYRRVTGRGLLKDIQDDFDSNSDICRLFSMILRAERPEDAAPVLPHEADQKVTELQRATEGQIGANGVAVAQIFSSSNDAQVRVITQEYERKYHRSLITVIEKEFSGDMEDALMRILLNAIDKGAADAKLVRSPLQKTMRKDFLLFNRIIRMYWDPRRMENAKVAYKKRYGVTMAADVKEKTGGDYERLLLALIG